MNFFRWPISLQTIIAMILGVIGGWVLGPKGAEFGWVAKYIIEVIKAVATPLLFFAIFDAFVSIDLRGKGFLWLVFVCAINACCAITIALTISHVFKPGLYLPVESHLKTDTFFINTLGLNFHWNAIFKNHQTIKFFSGTTAAIILSVLSGLIFLTLKSILGLKFQPSHDFLKIFNQKVLQFLFKAIGYLVHLTPLAVFTAMVKVVGTQGFSAMKGLGAYLLACSGGIFLQVILVYQTWIRGVAKKSLTVFWKECREPMIYSFGVNSSLATLPITLNAMKRLKVSDGSARLSACIGTNFNNDGILLYEVVAVLFVSQAFGLHLGLAQQLLLTLICVVATIGVAGVPEAGMISLTLVLSSVGLPIEILPVLMTVDWILARLRSVNNVIGDITGGIAIDACLERSEPRQSLNS